MKSLVYNAMRLPTQPIRARAENILRFVQEKDDLQEVKALFNYVQSHFHYVNDPTDIELIKTPDTVDNEITRTGVFIGDCDDASTYLASLLKSVGFSPYFIVAAPDDGNGFDLSHVYVRVLLPQYGQAVSLDVTAKGKPFGWSVPAVRIQEYAV